MGKTRTQIDKGLDFAEQLFPARPRKLFKRARILGKKRLKQVQKIGLALASNPIYLRWLKKESMLATAHRLSRQYSGSSDMWRNPFATPRPRTAIQKASVWYTAYPISMINSGDDSILSSFGDEKLWQTFETIGIRGLHTGPMKQAGGIRGWNFTPSIDGHFDRISNQIDPLFGTEREFRAVTATAKAHKSIIIDDIVPGHTGKGADFRLAEMNYREYPGIYHMVQIDPKDWFLLPEVPPGKTSANIDSAIEEILKDRGYIVGRLQRVIFYEPGVKETNWSATKPIRGVDGVVRRWVYLHYFKGGQPSLNWLDPSFAAMRLVIGDALHSIGELGSGALRLDANGFLGVERSLESTKAWSEGHPLSNAANQIIGSMVRKLGGFTFQELNLSMDDIAATSRLGADLSYDFVNRPAYHHALISADAEFLRLTLRESRRLGIDPASLVHALQNHDELTFELVHFWTVHKDDIYTFRGTEVTGSELRTSIRNELRVALTQNVTYNLPFTENGIACTTASVVAAALKITDITHLTEEDRANIQRGHLLLAAFNALQPGVFALSGWDLVGALTLSRESVSDLIAEGDTRWINRGAYDLMDANTQAAHSSSGIPKADAVYGSLPQQLSDQHSFASRLKELLAVREKYDIATSSQIDIPDVAEKGLLVMIHKLDPDTYQATVLNFSTTTISASVRSRALPPNLVVTDMFSEAKLGHVSTQSEIPVTLGPHTYTSLLLTEK